MSTLFFAKVYSMLYVCVFSHTPIQEKNTSISTDITNVQAQKKGCVLFVAWGVCFWGVGVCIAIYHNSVLLAPVVLSIQT